MNIMLVSVTERIREIGLRKALGATPSVIRRQFLVEASTLGLAGGIAGAALGVVGAVVIPHFITNKIAISVPATVGAHCMRNRHRRGLRRLPGFPCGPPGANRSAPQRVINLMKKKEIGGINPRD